MRKKLLALLMCATMVLGTVVTASAATTSKDAEKVYKDNADKFIAEYYPVDDVLLCDANNGTEGTVKYGYLNDATELSNKYTAVVVYKAASKTKLNDTVEKQYYAATPVDAYSKKLEAIEGENRPANTLHWNGKYSTVETDAAVERVNDAFENKSIKASDVARTFAVKVFDENQITFQIVTVNVAAAATTGTVGVSTEGYVDGTKRYVKAPNPAYTVAQANNLVKASEGLLKPTDESAIGKIFTYLDNASLEADDVVSAIDGGVFSKDAVGVKVTAYQQGVLANVDLGLENKSIYGGSAKSLYNFDMIQAGKYTFDSDLISRTGFKGAEAVNVFQPTVADVKFDEASGTLVKDFVKVATVAVGDTITFDNGSTLVSGVFVFDKGELAAEPEADKNDGVSDTTATTPAADNTASPKTGDVAPIAALAVVMMGAFGAMVVASKKRA